MSIFIKFTVHFKLTTLSWDFKNLCAHYNAKTNLAGSNPTQTHNDEGERKDVIYTYCYLTKVFFDGQFQTLEKHTINNELNLHTSAISTADTPRAHTST